MIEGVDFSWARPGGAALAAAGKKFVVRYVPTGSGRKDLDAAEIADYRAHDLAICLVWESAPGRAKAGTAAGRADATVAKAAAAALGFPLTTPIYFAVDFDAQSADFPAIDAYLRGAATVLSAPRVGVYGSARLMAHCANVKSAQWFWQTYAWSYGVIFPGNHLYQYNNVGQSINGGEVDLCRAMQANYGQWAPPSVPVPPPVHVAPQEDPTVRVVTVTIEMFPAPRTFTAAGRLRRFSATAEMSAIAGPYTATVDGTAVIESTGVPHGSGFLRLASGGSIGRYVLASAVTLRAE